MALEQEYATPENYLHAGERELHIQGTRDRQGATDFFLFNPPVASRVSVIRCGICKTEIPEGERRCPRCYEGLEEEK